MAVFPENAVNIGLFPSISTEHLTLLACFAAVAGVCLFVVGLRRFARKLSGGDVATSTVIAASPGLRAVSGKATGPYTIAAPISGELCLLDSTTVWQQVKSGRTTEWKKVAEETRHLPFFVEDSTGQLLVDPSNAGFDLRPHLCQEYGALMTWADLDKIPPRVSVFLARHRIELNRLTRIEECIIKPGATVFASGTVAKNPGIRVRPFSSDEEFEQPEDAAWQTREDTVPAASEPEVIRLSSGSPPASTVHMSQQGKIAAALSRAGMTNGESWGVVRVRPQDGPSNGVAIEQTALGATAKEQKALSVGPKATPGDPAEAGNESGFNLTPPLVLMKGSDETLFVISSERQRTANPVGWESVAMTMAGTVLMLVGFCVLLAERQLL